MNRTTKLLITTSLLLGLSAAPAGAAAQVGSPGRADDHASAPAPTGPRDGEIPLGSFSGPKRSAAGRHGAADSVKVGPTCSVQCITSGVAYGRGPDARLVVTTDTPATIRIVVSGPAGYSRQIVSGAGVTSFSADFDDLSADTSYDAIAIATDANGDTALRNGTFHTLQRNVEALITHAVVTDVPYGDEPFGQEIWFEGVAGSESWGEHVHDGILPLGINTPGATDTDRYLELEVELRQDRETDDICEAHDDDEGPEFGEYPCDYTAYAELPGGTLDLDDRPGDAGHWNTYEIDTDLVLATDFYSPLEFTVPVLVTVTWTPA